MTQDLYQQLIKEMNLALLDANHAYHNFCFANVNQTKLPEARIVILRDFCQHDKKIVFHTDIRSAKCQQITANPACTGLFYDPVSKMQLKFKALSTLHYKDDIASMRWDLSPLTCRRTYLKNYSPGSIISTDDAILPDKFLSRTPSKEESESGFENFAVVILHFYSLEILKLHHKGNECLRVDWNDGEAMFSRIAP